MFHYGGKTTKEIVTCLCAQFEQEPAKPDRVTFNAAKAMKDDDSVMEIDMPRVPELQILNKRNKEGDTALHIACKDDKPDCVSVLLCAGECRHLVLLQHNLCTGYLLGPNSIIDHFLGPNEKSGAK